MPSVEAPRADSEWLPVPGVVRLWNDREIQILVLFSFMLQVFLLLFAGRRRRNMSPVPRTLIWLAYLLADSIAIYTLGHMSLSCKSREQQQLVAVWAPVLLVHLGGQDTITAYSLEDNKLWPRHLLSLLVQALGVAYVMYKYMAAGSPTLVTAAVLILVAGVLKYGERIWALKSANLENLTSVLDSRKSTQEEFEPYCTHWLGGEEVLQAAHDLLPIYMGQFVDYKFWPSYSQCNIIKLVAEKGRMYKLMEMQLSLMYDVLYTKASVIHTWYGCFIRAVSLVAIITAFFLFHTSIAKHDFKRVDAVVTYILLAGALFLEMIAVLRAMRSTWTCAFLRYRRWDRLHSIVVSFRRRVKAAHGIRRWSSSIGQHKLLLKPPSGIQNICIQLPDFILKLKRKHKQSLISENSKELVLQEIVRMVEACDGQEEIMRSYSGQCVLKPYKALLGNDLTSTRTSSDFDEKILTWHYATELVLMSRSRRAPANVKLVTAIRNLSRYMVFLLVERPYMLPSPVRHKFYGNIAVSSCDVSNLQLMVKQVKETYQYSEDLPAFLRGAELARGLLDMEQFAEMLQLVLGVWVEMLSYAAHHCSRDSHARQLNSGTEFITIVWLLSTAMFNRQYCDDPWCKEGVDMFVRMEKLRKKSGGSGFLHELHRCFRTCMCFIYCFGKLASACCKRRCARRSLNQKITLIL